MTGTTSKEIIDGYRGFCFTTKTCAPIMPSAVNSVLYNIVNSYNKTVKCEGEEKLPKISAHILRHTACTRMAESGIDVKVLQYIMGHNSINVTMEVYNHVSVERRIICKSEPLAAFAHEEPSNVPAPSGETYMRRKLKAG